MDLFITYSICASDLGVQTGPNGHFSRPRCHQLSLSFIPIREMQIWDWAALDPDVPEIVDFSPLVPEAEHAIAPWRLGVR